MVQDCETAQDTWKRLEATYGGREIKDRMELRERLRRFEINESTIMLDHLARFFDLFTQLRAASGDLPDSIDVFKFVAEKIQYI